MGGQVVRFVICFVLLAVVSWAIGHLILGPSFADDYGPLMRGADDSGGLLPMIAGLAIVALAMIILYGLALPGPGRALAIGIAAGAVVIGQYFVLVGWSTLPPTATIISGVLSALGPVAGMAGVALYDRKYAA